LRKVLSVKPQTRALVGIRSVAANTVIKGWGR
jgi:hypothetical protein